MAGRTPSPTAGSLRNVGRNRATICPAGTIRVLRGRLENQFVWLLRDSERPSRTVLFFRADYGLDSTRIEPHPHASRHPAHKLECHAPLRECPRAIAIPKQPCERLPVDPRQATPSLVAKGTSSERE